MQFEYDGKEKYAFHALRALSCRLPFGHGLYDPQCLGIQQRVWRAVDFHFADASIFLHHEFHNDTPFNAFLSGFTWISHVFLYPKLACRVTSRELSVLLHKAEEYVVIRNLKFLACQRVARDLLFFLDERVGILCLRDRGKECCTDSSYDDSLSERPPHVELVLQIAHFCFTRRTRAPALAFVRTNLWHVSDVVSLCNAQPYGFQHFAYFLSAVHVSDVLVSNENRM